MNTKKQLTTITGLLSTVSKRNSALPILDNFMLKDGYIVASDLENTIEIPFNFSGENVLVDLKTVKEIIKNWKFTGLSFTGIKNEKGYFCQITSDTGQNVTLPGENCEDFPNVPKLQTETFSELTKEHFYGISNALNYVSKDEIRPAMTGISINKNAIVATDAHRLYKLDINTENQTENGTILPNVCCKILDKISQETAQFYTEQQNSAFVFPDGTKITTRNIDANYPNYDAVIPTNNEILATTTKESLMDAINAVLFAANKTTYQVIFNFLKGIFYTHTQDIDFAMEAKSKAPCTLVNSDLFQIGFNGKFILEYLKTLPKNSTVHLHMQKSTRAVLAKTDKENELVLIMPVMISKDLNDTEILEKSLEYCTGKKTIETTKEAETLQTGINTTKNEDLHTHSETTEVIDTHTEIENTDLLNAVISCQNIADKCNNAMLPQVTQDILTHINETLIEAINTHTQVECGDKSLIKAAISCQNIADRCNHAMLPNIAQELLKSIAETLKKAIDTNSEIENKSTAIENDIDILCENLEHTEDSEIEDEDIDLFEHIELLPKELQIELEKFGEVDNYIQCNALLKICENHGYTFDFYLNAEPYNLRRITHTLETHTEDKATQSIENQYQDIQNVSTSEIKNCLEKPFLHTHTKPKFLSSIVLVVSVPRKIPHISVPKQPKMLNEQQKSEILKLFSTHTQKKIAETVKCSEMQVQNFLAKQGLTGKRKLVDYKAIKKDIDKGMSREKLLEKYDIAYTTFQKIKWKVSPLRKKIEWTKAETDQLLENHRDKVPAHTHIKDRSPTACRNKLHVLLNSKTT